MKLVSAFFAVMVGMSGVVHAASDIAGATEGCKVEFSDKQLYTLHKAYTFGKRTQRGFTLAAIAWQESSAGTRLQHSDGPHWSQKSYGVFHNLLSTIKERDGCSKADCTDKKKKLLRDFQYSATKATEELDYWKNRLGHSGKAIAAYNTGNNWNSTRGKTYLKKINVKIRYLKNCIRFEE